MVQVTEEAGNKIQKYLYISMHEYGASEVHPQTMIHPCPAVCEGLHQ